MGMNNAANTADSTSNREAFRVHRGYSTVALVDPSETYIWSEYQKWLTWGPAFLASVRAAA
jgi:hypothetical protein